MVQGTSSTSTATEVLSGHYAELSGVYEEQARYELSLERLYQINLSGHRAAFADQIPSRSKDGKYAIATFAGPNV